MPEPQIEYPPDVNDAESRLLFERGARWGADRESRAWREWLDKHFLAQWVTPMPPPIPRINVALPRLRAAGVVRTDKESVAMDELELEIFRLGDHHTQTELNRSLLQELVTNFDPKTNEIPVWQYTAFGRKGVGLVAGLRRDGDRLLARLRNLEFFVFDPRRHDVSIKGSIEIYDLDQPGRRRLRSVSFSDDKGRNWRAQNYTERFFQTPGGIAE